MMTPALTAGWDNFYVITGSSAAGLTGLTFVVIALAADAQRVNATGLRAFVTPTIVHFGFVLALSAYLSTPRQSVLTLSIGIGAAGLAGVIYVSVVAMTIRGITSNYVPVSEDWIWNAILPALAYGALFGVAFSIWIAPQQSMYGVAAVCVALVFVGIHNAWDIAVWNTTTSKRADSK